MNKTSTIQRNFSTDSKKLCCSKLRCQENSLFTSELRRQQQARVNSLSATGRSTLAFQCLSNTGNCNYLILSTPVCQKFFAFWFGITHGTVGKLKQEIDNGELHHYRQVGKRKKSIRGETMISFMNAQFDKYACLHPVKKMKVLQSSITKQMIYNNYYQSEAINNNIPISRSQFYKSWKEQYPDVKVRKYCPFAECTTCEEFKRKKREATTPEDHKQLDIGFATHSRLFMDERKFFYQQIQFSKDNPLEQVCIAIDGAGQQKYLLPQLVRDRKDLAITCPQLKTHLMGVQVYNYCNIALVDWNQFPHNTNHVVSCILYAINTLGKILKQKSPDTKIWPKQLFLQLDNAGGQNKNQFMLAFLAILVKVGVFEQVYAHFNIVGHTHDIVDQMFSCFAHILKRTESLSPSELIDKFTDGYPGLLQPEFFNTIFEFAETLGPHNEPMVGISQPHHFLIELNEDKSIRLRTKNFASQEWSVNEHNIFKPSIETLLYHETRNGLLIRKNGPTILKSVISINDETKPEYYNIINSINPDNAIKKTSSFVKFDGIFTEAHKLDWKRFINDRMKPVMQEEVDKTPRNTIISQNQPLKHILSLLNNWTTKDIPAEIGGDINSAQCDISDKHNSRDPTRIGLTDEQSQLIVDANTQMTKSLIFNNGVQTKKTNDGLIDHETYEFTVGELVIVHYDQQDDFTDEENANYNLWPFLCEVANVNEGEDGDLIVFEYEEIRQVDKSGNFINMSYRTAVHDGAGETEKDAKVTSVISKSTVLFGNIKLSANRYIYSKQLEKYRLNINNIRKQAEGMQQFLNGEFSQQEQLPAGPNWIKN